VILRKLSNLEAQGGVEFFGEPECDVTDLLRITDGRGVSLLEVDHLQSRPVLFSTFLMWLLAELFEESPEAGDLDRPKLVFFFDEAHLLFEDASKAFLERIEQTVKLIRSKGVGCSSAPSCPPTSPTRCCRNSGPASSTPSEQHPQQQKPSEGERQRKSEEQGVLQKAMTNRTVRLFVRSAAGALGREAARSLFGNRRR
jgi:hypothetical protein